MLNFIRALLALIVVAVVFYFYGFERGYSESLYDTFETIVDKAKARGLITTPEEVEDFARQYSKIFYESEDE